jgi:hypothetical protein
LKDNYANPFQTSGVWYKGNLHTHTTNSDGLLSPDVIARYYQESGYDFLSITDHSVLTETCHLSSPDFLLLPGEEICAGISEARRLTHIVGINIEDEVPVEDFNRAENPQNIINLIKSLGGIAIIGHPYWSSLTINDLVSITGYAGIERSTTPHAIFQ